MVADARVQTEKSSRYLQALCGHFSRKTHAEYNPQQGRIEFGMGSCDLRAETDALVLQAEAPDAESLTRVKNVVGSHLERFAVKDDLHVTWHDQTHERQD